MSYENETEERRQFKKTIRENFEFRETGELVDLWLAHDTDNWTPETFEVIGEILTERGEDLTALQDEEEQSVPGQKRTFSTDGMPEWASHAVNMTEDQASDPFKEKSQLFSLAKKSREELEQKSTNQLIKLYRTQTTVLNVLEELLADRGVDVEEYSQNGTQAVKPLKCTVCDTDLPLDARFCPQCGMELYPEAPEEEEY